MARKLVLTVVTAALAVFVLGASSASAATEFGDGCVASRSTGEFPATLFDLSGSIPTSAPAAGVITSWKLSLNAGETQIPAIIPQTLKVLRLNTATKTALVVGEASGLVGSGTNTIPARIPVQAGDRLALFGSGPVSFEGSASEVGTLYCEVAAAPSIGAILGGPPAGSTGAYEELSETGIRVPGTARLEPDADGDGFGDESQDLCPQSAASQVACPVVKLSATGSAGKKLATVLVTDDIPAKVSVAGTVALGKGHKATLKAKAKDVTPGTLTKFKLKFSSALKSRLKELEPGRSLTLKVTVSAPNVAAKPTKKKLKLKLKGQG